MKRKNLLKVGLLAAGLLVGQSVWADTETLPLYSQDYEKATDASSWTNTDNITLSLATDNTKYISAVAGGSDRYCYTNFYDTEDFYGSYNSYQLTFDAAITKSSNHSSQFVVMADGHVWPGSVGKSFLQTNSKNYDEGTNAHLLLINIATSGTSTVKGDIDKEFTVDGSWLTFTLDVTTTAVNYSIANKSTKTVLASGTYTLPTGQSFKAKGLFSFLGRYANAGKICVDNIKVTTEVEAGFIETPTAAITAVNGINRTITFSCVTDGATLSYSTDGGESFTEGTSLVISSNTSVVVKASKGGKAVLSEVYEFEAGEDVELNVAAIAPTALVLNADGLYYPTVNATYTTAGVLLTPTATLTVTFNGTAVSLPYTPTTTGTLEVTASCDGYKSTTAQYNVVGYAKVLWKDYTTATTSGKPSGIRKWSDNGHWELAEGYGYKAIRTDANAWLQIDKAGMVAYEKLSEASAEATATLNIVVANNNTGNNSTIGFANGTVISKIYYFTEGKSVSVTDAGYATFCPNVNISFEGIEGLEACKAAVDADGKITYTTVNTVKAGEGVLLRSTDGNAAVVGAPVIEEATMNEDNAFVGITEKVKLAQSTESGYINYILSIKNDVIGFYKVNTKGSWCNAGTAYLKVADSVTPARGFFALWEDNTTGIQSVESTKTLNGEAYNLNGQRVAQPQNGLYIVNGKKVIIK